MTAFHFMVVVMLLLIRCLLLLTFFVVFFLCLVHVIFNAVLSVNDHMYTEQNRKYAF